MNQNATAEFDKIAVLLVDDMPEGFPYVEPRTVPVPTMSSEYSEWFDFKWLATPEECREYRDLSWLIAQRDPRLLAEVGWIPEVLVIDYALTQNTRTVAARVESDPEWCERLSPLPSLRECACEVLKRPPASNEAFTVHPQAGTEYWGCFIGGLLMLTFGEHPCAPITITRYTQQMLQTQAVDVAFFEWLMAAQSSGLLRAKGTVISPSWSDVLPTAVKHLRHRLRDLASCGIIHLSLDDLLELHADGAHPVLTMTSRYGRRRYPIAGLFVDVPESQRAAAAMKWADEVLAEAMDLFKQESSGESFVPTLEDLIQGRELARSLWDAYCDDEVIGNRIRLSELLTRKRGAGYDKTPLDTDEKDELGRLLKHFGVIDAERASPTCNHHCLDMRQPGYDQKARRWAVLMILLHLLHDRHRALTLGRAEIDATFGGSIGPADVYLALFPAPTTPVLLPWHAEKSDPAASWSRYLREVDLDLRQLLDGKGDRSATTGERHIMRMFSASLDTQRGDWHKEDWEQDSVTKNVLSDKATEKS